MYCSIPVRAWIYSVLAVGAPGRLAENPLLVVLLQPLGGSLDTLGPDGGGDTVCVCAGTVAAEVLVHLVDNLVGGIRQGGQRSSSAGGDLLSCQDNVV